MCDKADWGSSSKQTPPAKVGQRTSKPKSLQRKSYQGDSGEVWSEQTTLENVCSFFSVDAAVDDHAGMRSDKGRRYFLFLILSFFILQTVSPTIVAFDFP